MAKPSFDPSKPFEPVAGAPAAKPAFNPDAPFASAEPSAHETPHPGFLESAAAGASQAALGLGDEAGALFQAALNSAQKFKSPQEAEKAFWDTYRQARFENRQIDKAAAEEHPGVYYGALAAGSVGTARLLPSVTVAKGAGLATKMAAGAATGAGQGLAFGAGMSEADLTKGEGKRFAADTATGGVVGGALGAAAAPIAAGMGKVSNYFAGKATDASDRAIQMATQKAAEEEARLSGGVGGEIQKGSRFAEQFARYADDPSVSPALRSMIRNYQGTPQARALIESVLSHQLEQAPGQAGKIAALKAELAAFQQGKSAVIANEAARLKSPAEAALQFGARALRYGPPIAGDIAAHIVGEPGRAAAAGLAGAVGGGDAAAGALGGAGLRPAFQAIRRMVGHPSIAYPIARTAEALTGWAGQGVAHVAEPAAQPLAGEAVRATLSDIIRTRPQALGAFAGYFPPNASEQDNEVTAYTLTRTQPGFQEALKRAQEQLATAP